MARKLLILTGIIWFYGVFSDILAQTGTFHNLVVSDGPYIIIKDGKMRLQVIKNNRLREKIITQENYDEFKEKHGFNFSFSDLKDTFQEKPNPQQYYSNIDSFAVISDIHGEYNTYIRLLRGIGVIDRNHDWNFGRGHLVLLGDIFDRGEMVTEVLWHLFGLEKQAMEAGGRLHLLLGNHELMVLSHDLRYISDKYRKIEEVTGKSYSDFFSNNSVLGRWLRSKPVIITINDNLLLHAGISMEMVRRYFSLASVNQLIDSVLLTKDSGSDIRDEKINFLMEDSGPLWYRGYFNDPDFRESTIDSILTYYKARRIIVGHTPSDRINTYFGNKLIGVDSGIGYGEKGEMLLIKQNIIVRYNSSGRRTILE